MNIDDFIEAEASKHGVRKNLATEYVHQLKNFRDAGTPPAKAAGYFRYTYGTSPQSPYQNERAVKEAFNKLSAVQ